MAVLTKKRLLAIREALTARLAGAIESDIERKDYKAALEWAEAKVRDKERKIG